MVSVKCYNISCKYLSQHSDTCKAKKIGLNWHSIVTMHEGRKEFLTCNVYEPSDEYVRLAGLLEEVMKKDESGKGVRDQF